MYLFVGIYTLRPPVIVLGGERPGWRKYLDPPVPTCLPLSSSDAAQIPRKASRSYFHFTHPPTGYLMKFYFVHSDFTMIAILQLRQAGTVLRHVFISHHPCPRLISRPGLPGAFALPVCSDSNQYVDPSTSLS
jgi:hypothetical protein